MYLGRCSAGGEWQGGVTDYGPLPLDPAAQVLSYGQAIIEGLKAQRTANGDIAIFRPQAHAERMHAGAARMCMPSVPEALFVDAVERTVRANARLVPPMGAGVLYIRPLLLGSAPRLGVGPADAYTFVVFCAAVGNYYKGQDEGAELLVETEFHRGAPGGVGATKCAGNYAAVLQAQQKAKRAGFTDVLLLDCTSGHHLEEASAGNVFIVSGKQVKTPRLKGTFLAGVTRSSVLQLLEEEGYEVTEEDVSVDDAMEAEELFMSGTAAGVCLSKSLTFEGIYV